MTGKVLTPRKKRRGFALIEVMIVVAIAVPGWMRQRNRAQQRSCQETLTKIDGVKEQWALEQRKSPTDTPTLSDLYSNNGRLYLKTEPRCLASETYTFGQVGEAATCSITLDPYDHNEHNYDS